MAYATLYIDTLSGALVTGVNNATESQLPKLVQGDTIAFRIYLLERSTTFPYTSPFSIVNNADLSLSVAIGPKDGTAGSTLYTQQFTWAKDGANQYFYANLPLNTANITSLLGSAATASAFFEVQYVQNGYATTVYQEACTIHAEVIEAGSVVAPVGQIAATLDYVNSSFVKNENNGFVLANATTGNKVFVYLGDDNTVHFDPIT